MALYFSSFLFVERFRLALTIFKTEQTQTENLKTYRTDNDTLLRHWWLLKDKERVRDNEAYHRAIGEVNQPPQKFIEKQFN